MPKYAPPSKWTDEFNTPTVSDLRTLVVCDAKKAFDKTCSKIEALGEFDIKTGWFGECWFWSVVFLPQGADDRAPGVWDDTLQDAHRLHDDDRAGAVVERAGGAVP